MYATSSSTFPLEVDASYEFTWMFDFTTTELVTENVIYELGKPDARDCDASDCLNILFILN